MTKLPKSVKWIRVLLYFSAGLIFAFSLATLVLFGFSAYELGYVLVASLPGVAQFLLALFIRRNGRVVFWSILAVETIFVLYTLITLAEEGRLSQLILPAVVLILLFRPASRRFFLG
ncbi:MAG: hypothetical protein M0026_18060 [Nocardiopsaceae bacterium]|nr:hypothetical protein [Nocardiopsaceae bacterium]